MSDALEHLVAFASAVSWLEREPVSRRYEQHVLDSLPSICVRKGMGEVYAIAMQLEEDNKRSWGTITLTIAGNHGLPKEVSSYLHKTCQRIQEIAKSCYMYHKNRGQSDQRTPPTREALADAKPLVLLLKIDLYNQSFDKFASRLKKRNDEFMGFVQKLENHLAMAPPAEKHDRDV
jgi:hypothetical protein